MKNKTEKILAIFGVAAVLMAGCSNEVKKEEVEQQNSGSTFEVHEEVEEQYALVTEENPIFYTGSYFNLAGRTTSANTTNFNANNYITSNCAVKIIGNSNTNLYYGVQTALNSINSALSGLGYSLQFSSSSCSSMDSTDDISLKVVNEEEENYFVKYDTLINAGEKDGYLIKVNSANIDEELADDESINAFKNELIKTIFNIMGVPKFNNDNYSLTNDCNYTSNFSGQDIKLLVNKLGLPSTNKMSWAINTVNKYNNTYLDNLALDARSAVSTTKSLKNNETSFLRFASSNSNMESININFNELYKNTYIANIVYSDGTSSKCSGKVDYRFYSGNQITFLEDFVVDGVFAPCCVYENNGAYKLEFAVNFDLDNHFAMGGKIYKTEAARMSDAVVENTSSKTNNYKVKNMAKTK